MTLINELNSSTYKLISVTDCSVSIRIATIKNSITDAKTLIQPEPNNYAN